eukprot:8027263-Alexandrium_andersonii.AAC.1
MPREQRLRRAPLQLLQLPCTPSQSCVCERVAKRAVAVATAALGALLAHPHVAKALAAVGAGAA